MKRRSLLRMRSTIDSHEEAYKRKAATRKEKIRTLAADAQAQDDVIQSYHAMLEMADPEKAARIAWTDDGRVVLQEKQPLRRTRRHKAAQKQFAKVYMISGAALPSRPRAPALTAHARLLFC